jgi:cytochrome b6-f complex subunit 7
MRKNLDAIAQTQGDYSMTADQILFNSAVLSFTLILIGLALGFLLLKIQGSAE